MPTDPSSAAKLLGSRGGRKATEAQRAARSRNIGRANLRGKIETTLGDSIVRCEVDHEDRRVWLILNFVPHDSLAYLERLSETMIAGGLLPNGWTVGLTKENA